MTATGTGLPTLRTHLIWHAASTRCAVRLFGRDIPATHRRDLSKEIRS